MFLLFTFDNCVFVVVFFFLGRFWEYRYRSFWPGARLAGGV